MKNYLVKIVGGLGIGLLLSSCGNNATNKFVGTWQEVNESASYFVISKTDKGLVLKSPGESSTISVTISGNDLIVDGTNLTLDEKNNELSMTGLFDKKIIFKKVNGTK